MWLIKLLVVRESYKWIEEFINDETVITWAVGLLDQLLWNDIINYDEEKENVDFLLKLAGKSQNENLLENINFINHYLEDRRLQK